MSAFGVTNYVITEHALFEMKRRSLGEDVQSVLLMGATGQEYLVRVFVDIDRDPAEVVTVYRTSKIGKYWRTES
jgi:hypothetical protein